MSTASRARGGYLQLAKDNKSFRYLWIGQIISLFGDWFNLIASASLVASLTDSGLAVGTLFVVRMLAPFLVSPLAGVAADRFNRKRLLIWSDLIRAVTAFGFLLVREPGDVWLLYALTALQLGISGVFFPTRNAILPDIVSPQELGAANALSSATWSVMLAVGAALGGVVSGTWGIYPAFTIDGLTFILSAVFIGLVPYRPPKGDEASRLSPGEITGEWMEGLRYLKSNRDILIIVLLKTSMALAVSGGFQVAQVALAEEVYVIGEGGGVSLGLIYAVVGVGTGLGPILSRAVTGDRDRPLRIAIAGAYVITVIGLAIAAPLFGFGLVLFGTLLRALGAGTNWVFSTQLLLQTLPERVRGRVFSMEFAFLTLANAISAYLAGWLLDSSDLGISGLLWGMAGLTLVFGLLWSLWVFYAPFRRDPSLAAPRRSPPIDEADR